MGLCNHKWQEMQVVDIRMVLKSDSKIVIPISPVLRQ